MQIISQFFDWGCLPLIPSMYSLYLTYINHLIGLNGDVCILLFCFVENATLHNFVTYIYLGQLGKYWWGETDLSTFWKLEPLITNL